MVLYVDEKSQIQAFDRTHPMSSLPPGIADAEPCIQDYMHHGTATLFATLDMATCGNDRRDTSAPSQLRICTLSAHRRIQRAVLSGRASGAGHLRPKEVPVGMARTKRPRSKPGSLVILASMFTSRPPLHRGLTRSNDGSLRSLKNTFDALRVDRHVNSKTRSRHYLDVYNAKP
jgi:hypothetical protein